MLRDQHFKETIIRRMVGQSFINVHLALAAGTVTSSFRWSTAWDDDQSLKRHEFKSYHFFRRGVKTASRSKQQILSKANQPESSYQSLSPHMFCKKVFWFSSHQPFQSNNYALFVYIESLWRRWSNCFAYSYTQPTVQLYITPLIAFIFDEFTFFEATPWPVIDGTEELETHIIGYRWSLFIA